jgi:hypothetical protein
MGGMTRKSEKGGTHGVLCEAIHQKSMTKECQRKQKTVFSLSSRGRRLSRLERLPETCKRGRQERMAGSALICDQTTTKKDHKKRKKKGQRALRTYRRSATRMSSAEGGGQQQEERERQGPEPMRIAWVRFILAKQNTVRTTARRLATTQDASDEKRRKDQGAKGVGGEEACVGVSICVPGSPMPLRRCRSLRKRQQANTSTSLKGN